MPLYPHSIPRCQHIKVNGTQCGSPALRRNRLCYFHKSWQQTRIVLGANRARRAPAVFDLPMLEDANSIQVALMQVMRLILSGQIDAKTAGLLLYALQTASTNLARTNFEPTIKTRVVIDPRTVAQTPLGEDPWRRQDYEEEDNQQENDEAIAAEEESIEEKIPQIQAVAETPQAKQQGAPLLAVFARGGRGHKKQWAEQHFRAARKDPKETHAPHGRREVTQFVSARLQNLSTRAPVIRKQTSDGHVEMPRS